MKREVYKYPHSTFLSTEKDLSILVDLILKNENLKKLLYYTTKDCLNKPKLTEDQSLSLFGNNIRIVPKVEIDENIKNYLFISFDDFITNPSNPEFRNNSLHIDIVCHFDQWHLKDFSLRPYKIAAEIDTMLKNQRLTGIGQMYFVGAKHEVLSNDWSCLCMVYQAIHGEEDKIGALNPVEEERATENFNEVFNS